MLPPPELDAYMVESKAELTWQAKTLRHDGYVVWASSLSNCILLGPGDTTVRVPLVPGTNAISIRAFGETSIGAWSSGLIIQIGPVFTGVVTPPARWFLAGGSPGTWLVFGPGQWTGGFFADYAQASSYAAGRLLRPADINGDNRSNSQDLFDFVLLFVLQDGGADWTGDGEVNTADFFDFFQDLLT